MRAQNESSKTGFKLEVRVQVLVFAEPRGGVCGKAVRRRQGNQANELQGQVYMRPATEQRNIRPI
jgi:hypothetical protein